MLRTLSSVFNRELATNFTFKKEYLPESVASETDHPWIKTATVLLSS